MDTTSGKPIKTDIGPIMPADSVQDLKALRAVMPNRHENVTLSRYCGKVAAAFLGRELQESLHDKLPQRPKAFEGS